MSETHEAISLLKQIITIPSQSGEEDLLANYLVNWFKKKGFLVNRKSNNLWVESVINESLPRVLLNSHMDTVKAVSGWTKDPYIPEIEEGKIYGLGSSDAGGSLVALIFAFLRLAEIADRKFNLVLLISAEEENSGKNGISSALEEIEKIDFALVGEPTDLSLAVSERGLVVIDCTARGRAGHVAHQSGENAIYKAMADIERLQRLDFKKVSPLLGKVQVETTQIKAGYQHNVVPDECKFVLDVRTNEYYSNEEVVEIISTRINSILVPRSLRLKSSSIPESHPLVQKAKQMGISLFGSKTMSDQALIPAHSAKIGPGKSELSHKADEHIEIHEIIKAIDLYYNLLKDIY